MEVKPCYKQTEVGVIPEDWEVGNLERFWSVIDCKHVTADFVDNGIPVASITEVQSRFVNLDNAKQTTRAYYQRLIERGRKPIPGDLIFSRNATVGEVAQVAEWHPVFAMGQDVCLLKKLSPNYSADFMQAVIRSPVVVAQLENLMVGSTFKRVNVEQIRNLAVPFPAPPEQVAIAEALSDVDGLIESLELLIAKKRLIKQGAMQELLTGKKRLSGFHGEWGRCTLGDLFVFKNGLNKSKGFFGKGTPIINYMDVYRNSALFSAQIDGRVEVTSQERQTFDVRKSDVFFTRTSETADEVGLAAAMLDEPEDTVFSGFLLRARPTDESLHDEFKRYCFASEGVRRQIVSKASYTTRALTNGRLLSTVTLDLPPRKEQEAIAAVLSGMDTEIAALEGKIAKARQVKQGMMQELLTGRIRLV